jgi:hypothetical protein
MGHSAEECEDERVKCDDGKCDIGVVKADHGFRGCWKSLKCEQAGESASIYPHRSSALAWARRSAASHGQSH